MGARLWLPARGPELCPGQRWLPGEPLGGGGICYLAIASSCWEHAPARQQRAAVCYLQAPLRTFTKFVSVKGWDPDISCWSVMGSILFQKNYVCV